MKPRILQIIATLDRAGAEKQLSLLACGLPRDCFDVHVCALTRGGPLEADLHTAGIPTVVLNKRSKADPIAFGRLVAHIKHLRPDLIHTWMFTANAYGRAAGRWAGVKRMIASERCLDPWKSNWQHAIDRYLAKQTQAIVTNAQGVRDFYLQHGMDAEKLQVIPNGLEPMQPSRYSHQQFLRMFNLPADVPLIGAVGRFWPQKRMKYLIWAAEVLHLLHPKAQLLIAGDGPLREQVMRYCSLLDGDSYIHFLGHRDDISDLLPHLDMFWHASGYEGLPNAVMEAMAAGLPVVATDVPGNRDLIRSEETGILVSVDDRADLVRASDRLIADPNLRTRLGTAAQEHVLANYPLQTMIDRYAQLYDQTLASPA